MLSYELFETDSGSKYIWNSSQIPWLRPGYDWTLSPISRQRDSIFRVSEEDPDILCRTKMSIHDKQLWQQQSHQQLLLGHEFKREIKEEPDVFDDSPTATNQLNSFIEQTPPSLFSIHQQQPPTTDQSNFVTLVGPNSSTAVVTSSTAEHQFNSSSSRCSSSLSDSLRSFLSKDRNIGSVKSEMESGQAVASALVTTDSTGKKWNRWGMSLVFSTASLQYRFACKHLLMYLRSFSTQCIKNYCGPPQLTLDRWAAVFFT